MTNVTITSAFKLETKQLDKIKTAVTKKYGAEVSYTLEVKPEILGGVILTIDSRQLDGSLKTKLAQIKQALNQKIVSE